MMATTFTVAFSFFGAISVLRSPLIRLFVDFLPDIALRYVNSHETSPKLFRIFLKSVQMLLRSYPISLLFHAPSKRITYFTDSFLMTNFFCKMFCTYLIEMFTMSVISLVFSQWFANVNSVDHFLRSSFNQTRPITLKFIISTSDGSHRMCMVLYKQHATLHGFLCTYLYNIRKHNIFDVYRMLLIMLFL